MKFDRLLHKFRARTLIFGAIYTKTSNFTPDLRDTARVNSSLTGVPVTIDGKPEGQLESDGLQILALSQGTHRLVLGVGATARDLSFEVGPGYGLDVTVFADRDVGSLLILAGQDDAEVIVDGKPQSRKTQHGQLRIPNLRSAQHTVRVHKDGFKDPPDQTVSLLKGQEANLRFTLEPLPKVATVVFEGLPAGTQVALDGMILGNADGDGALRASIPPGSHILTFNSPGYETARIDRTFGVGQTVSISRADLGLKRAQGTLEITAASNISVTIEQNGRIVRQFTGSSKIPLDAGTYTLTSRVGGGSPTTTTVTVAAGEVKAMNLHVVDTGNWEHPENWKLQDGWYVQRGNGFVLYDAPPGPANYEFALGLRHSKARIRWVVGYLDPRNYFEIQMDSKFLYRSEVVDGASHELLKTPHHIPEHTELAIFDVQVTPTQLLLRYKLPNADWQTLDSWEVGKGPSLNQGKTARDFTKGKFGFLIPEKRDIEMSNFTYSRPK